MQINLIAAASIRAKDETKDWDEEGEKKNGYEEVEQAGVVALWYWDILHNRPFARY